VKPIVERMVERHEELSRFEHEGHRIPAYMHEGLVSYIEQGRPPGDFLMSVFKNDLMNTYAHADGTNLRNVVAYVMYLYNYCPSTCFGSAQNVKDWIAQGGLEGLNNEQTTKEEK